ncbi:hypothetical protein CC1G_07810 [Coprinopsis cinerea okayama7|uniref:Uncharacterized protein n=1 Tax=Coprinopsis cinerea (strain Okayama-7 / 130 / ATCC MYA-4618 / FGSC 9003) TaxID=240176 RepID=A8NP51_COPC7|nr:hypothetical protein CC1G_07810 [Coprinopsis cinerea okayama7\|eukprot:XP_001835267.1 hypothetical protein CC1G_07810 [Coprinopsis cinerea okayama7\
MAHGLKALLPVLFSLVVIANALGDGNDAHLQARATPAPAPHNPCGSEPYGGEIVCLDGPQVPYCTLISGSAYLCQPTKTVVPVPTPPIDPLARCTPPCTPGINYTTRTVWTECSCAACPTISCGGDCGPGSTNAITTGTNGCASCGSCVPTGNARREPVAEATPAVTHL